jgi:hypothetical protein
MEIVYIAIADTGLKGVFSKVTGTINALADVGLNIRGLIMSSETASTAGNAIDVLQYTDPTKIYPAIEQYLSKNYRTFPLLYFRYPFADRHLSDFVKKRGTHIVFEHNTIEESELALYFKYYTTRDFFYNLRKLDFSDAIGKRKLLKEEKNTGREILSYAKAGIAVTTEIAAYENSRAGKAYCKHVLGNAVYASVLPRIKKVLSTDTNKLRCIFVAGHANNWHGIDRAIQGMGAYKGTYDISLIYVGKVLHTVKEQVEALGLSSKVVFAGMCEKDKLEELMLNTDLAISTLALHRIPLKQGSVLKTREYLLHGVPTLIGYEDEELEADTLLNKYLIKAGANDTPIDFELVIGELKKITASGVSPVEISTQLFKEYGIQAKAQQLKKALLELSA